MSLPKLSGKQMEILYLRDDKNLLIKGSAGSGKSLITIYRAIWISLKYPDKKVLVLTYNHAVNKKMNEDVKAICRELKITLNDNLDIRTYHSFCLSTIKKLTPIVENNDISSGKYSYYGNKYKMIKAIVQELKGLYPETPSYKRPEFVFLDEISWIQSMNIRSLDDYIATERIGRQAVRITRADRKYFYEVYERYKSSVNNQADGRYYDYEDIGDNIRDSFSQLKESEVPYVDYLYDFVLIDEFQDFTVNMLTSIQSILKEDGIVSLFGDTKQSIFENRISMKRIGFKNFSSYIIEHNYRNSKEISLYARKIADSPYLNKNDEFYVKTIISKRATNNNPIIQNFNSEIEELNWMKDIINLHPNQHIAILPNPKNLKRISRFLEKNNINYDTTDQRYRYNQSGSNVLIATAKQVKGLEFDVVIIPLQGIKEYVEIINYRSEIDKLTINEIIQVCKENPDKINKAEFDIRDKLEELISEIYVSVSRAKNYLYISYTDELFPLYPSVKSEGEL
ncbi:UvrD-helicase domain-containing protein [Macrococcus capreoli]